MRSRPQWSGRESSRPASSDRSSIAAGRGLGGNREVPPLQLSALRGDLSAARSGANLQEGGPRGKHGFPRATERPPKAAAQEGRNGAVARARGRRAVTNDIELVVVETADDVARAVAERLARAARAGGHIALTGGKTPEQAYKEAAQREPDWSNTELWWSDERCVPPDDELSNYHLAKRTLLDALDGAPKAVHRIRGELGKEAAADEYERELGDTEFDLELLGIGPD